MWYVVRKHYFCERVLAPWNYLRSTNATLQSVHSVAAFKSLVKRTDLSSFFYTCNSSGIDCLYWLHSSMFTLKVAYLLVHRLDILQL